MASFDGKTLDEFYKTDYDYLEGRTNQRGDRAPSGAEVAIDIATGGGPRSDFFRPLRNAGIPRDKYNFYADKAEVRNVNSKNDFDAIIAAYEADQMKNDDSSESEEEVETPSVPFAKSEEMRRTDNNRPYLDRIASNNRRGISNYVFGSDDPRQNVFDRDGNVKSDDKDMRDKDKDEESMDFVNRYKAKIIDQTNRFDRAGMA